MISRLVLKPNHGTSVNRHQGYELLVPLEGEAEVQLEPNKDGPTFCVSAEKQTLAHYISNRDHRVWNHTKEDCRLLVIRFYGDIATPRLTTRG
jgi:hypothetical protein